MTICNTFISHSWKHDNHYQKIVDFLNSDPTFKWEGYSIPINVIAGVYASYSKWIDAEIDIAQKYNKPIVTVLLWGAERSSDRAQSAATEVVAWQSNSIIQAIKRHL